MSMAEYFKRGFIGTLNKTIKITIYKDEYDVDGKLIKLTCEVDNPTLERVERYTNSVVEFRVHGVKTMKRKEEFEFKRNIMINKVIRRSVHDEKNIIAISVTEQGN